MKRAFLSLVLLLAVSGCVREYRPSTPHTAQVGSGSLSLTTIETASGAVIYPPHGGVVVQGHYRVEAGDSFTTPVLTKTNTPPCSGGTRAHRSEVNADNGTLAALFPRDELDSQRLLATEPTALDVNVVHADGTRECLRVPVLSAPARTEWLQDPAASLGYAFTLLVPFRRIYAAGAAPMLTLRGGPFIGPLRLRAELGIGGAFAENRNANLVAYSYRAGLLLDALLAHIDRFGFGVAAGYDVTGISLDASVQALSHEGVGFQGLIYGPRAGVSFELLPTPPLGPAFRARPDAASASLELYLAAESSHDHDKPTPALWFTVGVDVGL
ncbi:MAG TPA: hypothetical protein VHV51_08245 [Polyangiaceae bacterium]|nr:hypothetical protein [Polyangiaceae bacterium]